MNYDTRLEGKASPVILTGSPCCSKSPSRAQQLPGTPLFLATKGCDFLGQLFPTAAYAEVNINKCLANSPVLAKDKSRGDRQLTTIAVIHFIPPHPGAFRGPMMTGRVVLGRTLRQLIRNVIPISSILIIIYSFFE